MKDTRKDIRIRLPESAVDAFAQAKAKAEAELGITLKDGEFAARVLVQAVKGERKPSPDEDAADSDIDKYLADRGMIAVPMLPTGDMIGAGNDAIVKSMSGTELDLIYDAMIKAAGTK